MPVHRAVPALSPLQSGEAWRGCLLNLSPKGSIQNVRITLFRDDEDTVGLHEQSFCDQFNTHLCCRAEGSRVAEPVALLTNRLLRDLGPFDAARGFAWFIHVALTLPAQPNSC